MVVDIITMGCSKNLVDSERLLSLFSARGIKAYHNPQETHGDVAVVNTCGFITSAKEESINTILELCNQKEAGFLKRVYVMGCLSERYMDELKAELPGIDAFYGKFNWEQLIDALPASVPTSKCNQSRVITTPSHYAYIKISEGCNRHCAYCAIPIITGHHHSRPMEEILDEVRDLVQQGVKEFQVIAQELTYYGIDLYHKPRIADLIEQMAKIPGVEWIRLHYAYPTQFPVDLLKVMRDNPNVCKYLDIALQHISDNVLERMQRHVTKAETLQLLSTMRKEVPGINIRTTLMVGFPGETDEDFQELLDFVKDARFERMGAFAYSEEDGTYAAKHYTDDIPEDIKQERLDQLMALQQEISTEINAKRVGDVLKVIIDRKESDFYVGRTEYDSPDVDGEVLIPTSEALTVGEFYSVLITDATDYDLYGTTNIN